jgi:hypothetical protein
LEEEEEEEEEEEHSLSSLLFTIKRPSFINPSKGPLT